MNQTLTKSIKAELRGFADRITPPDQKPGAQPGKALTADEMRQRYGITTDAKGQPLRHGQLYLAKDLPAVNHHRRLCRAFEVGGWDHVERYLQPYRTPEAIARQAAEAAQVTEATAGALPAAEPGAVLSGVWVDEATELEPEQLQQLSAGRICGAECGAVVCPCEGACS